MSEWHDYVRQWAMLSPEQQQAALSQLSPDQRALFDQARGQLGQGLAAPPLPQPKKRGGLKWALGCGCLTLVAIAVFIGVAINAGGGLAETERIGREAHLAREEKAAAAEAASALTISAVALIREYDSNEIAADQRYKGKKLVVEGVVDDIGKDVLDTMYVTLAGPEDSFRSVQCFFSDGHENTLAQLGRGQYLRAIGRCDGVFGNVLLKDCRLLQ